IRRFSFNQAEGFAQVDIDVLAEVRVVLQKLPRILTALADALAFVTEPRATLFDDVVLNAEIDHFALARDTLAVNDVELRLPEWGGQLVLHNLDLRAVSDHILAILDRRDPANVDAHGGIKLQRTAA